MTDDPLAKHPGIAWAFRLAELEGFPGDRLMVYAYTRVHSGKQHIPKRQRTPEGVTAAKAETNTMRLKAKELTRQLDDAGLLDWSLCDAK